MDAETKQDKVPSRAIESKDEHVNADEARLAQLGHAQELERQYSFFALGTLCVCLMGTWEALSTVVVTALLGGGAPCLFWNLPALLLRITDGEDAEASYSGDIMDLHAP